MQSKLEKLREDLGDILANSKSPIVAWSSGKDSQLILYLCREIVQNIGVLVFNALWNDYQKIFVAEMVQKWDLKVFFYRPNRFSLIGESIASFYQIGDRELPVLQDVIFDNRCGLDAVSFPPAPIPPFLWTDLIVGSKKVDKHPLLPEMEWFDPVKTPLWEWTDEEVWEAINLLDIPVDKRVYSGDEKADTGNFVGCLKCAKTTEQVFCPKSKALIQGIAQT